MNYPFNKGDLAISVNVLYNYLEVNSIVPWVDLRWVLLMPNDARTRAHT